MSYGYLHMSARIFDYPQLPLCARHASTDAGAARAGPPPAVEVDSGNPLDGSSSADGTWDLGDIIDDLEQVSDIAVRGIGTDSTLRARGSYGEIPGARAARVSGGSSAGWRRLRGRRRRWLWRTRSGRRCSLTRLGRRCRPARRTR